MRWSRISLLGGALCLGMGAVASAVAAEITVLSGGAVKSAFGEVAAQFERGSGHRVRIGYAPMGVLVGRLEKGEIVDVVVLTAEVRQGMGIAEAVKGKTTLGAEGFIAEPVARGNTELAIHQISEILPVKGAQLVGPLRRPLQKVTVYAAALTPRARDTAAVSALLDALRSPAARQVFVGKGFAL